MSCSRGCCASFKEHVRSIKVIAAPSATSRGESQLSRDLDAYQRMTASGVQPPNVYGAAELERGAEARHEVEQASIMLNARDRRLLDKAHTEAPPPALTPLDT